MCGAGVGAASHTGMTRWWLVVGLLVAGMVGCARSEDTGLAATSPIDEDEHTAEAQDPWTTADCLHLLDHSRPLCNEKVTDKGRAICIAAVLAMYYACEKLAAANDNGTGFGFGGEGDESGTGASDFAGLVGGLFSGSDNGGSGYSRGGGVSGGGGSSEDF